VPAQEANALLVAVAVAHAFREVRDALRRVADDLSWPPEEKVAKTNDELIAEQLRTDPEFRAEWERTALARAVAVAIVRYRADHDLSQRELAERVGMKQPQVARLELGEVNPSMETLMRVSAQLGIEFTIDVRPAGTTVHNVTKRAQVNNLVGSIRTSEAEVLVAGATEARFTPAAVTPTP
jgi:transcriptional regulator with XRE-family HTH domain